MSDNEGISNTVTLCCIGVIVIALIIAGVSMLFNNDNPNQTASLVLGDKSFTLDNMTSTEISNIKGNNSDSIAIMNDEGKLIYNICKSTESTTVLNELGSGDNVTKVESNGITYQNIIFSDGTPSMTVFKTNDGSIYEITYYNGNDFIFDYQDLGNQLNK